MPKYWVTVVNTVSAEVEVEADTPDAATELVFDADGMPGSITVGAFGGADNVDDGEWNPVRVATEDGLTVWSEDDSQDGPTVIHAEIDMSVPPVFIDPDD